MEHIAAFMLLVGCNSGSLTCEELQAPQVAFESMEECVDALPATIGAAGTVKRIVHARCAAIDPAWIEEDVEISWRMTKDKGLMVEVRQVDPPASDVVVAENAHPLHGQTGLH